MAFCCAGSARVAAVVYAFITDLINYHILRILLICNISQQSQVKNFPVFSGTLPLNIRALIKIRNENEKEHSGISGDGHCGICIRTGRRNI
ncbi:hypothetical protein DMI62_17655 [Escherichia coli]|nr:hypothetical protein [Escherichia coli]